MNYVKTPRSTKNPSWTNRNLEISKRIDKNKSILDLGCGSKDLLNYTTPSYYIGIDYNDIADIKINFNEDFTLPSDKFDYIVCSGLLEYLTNVELFLSKIKNSAETYIISYWSKHNSIREAHQLPEFTLDQFENCINENFLIIEKFKWKSHTVLVCKNKK